MTLTIYFSVENQVFILRNETLDLYAQNVVNLQKQKIVGKKRKKFIQFI